MRFNRLALIAACEQALAGDRNRFDRRKADLTAKHATEVTRWNSVYASQWDATALRIRREIRKGNPITMDMLPLNSWRDAAVFKASNDPNREYQEPRELVGLLTVLGTVADEVVSIASLERLGISRTVIREAAMHLSAASVSGADS
jgi:hypothetical protein